MNKKFLLVIVLLIIVITGVVIFSLWPKKKLPEVKIAGTALSSLVAEEKGFFKEEDLQVKLERMSAQDSISALLAGKVDYATFGVFAKPPIKASLRGAPIKTIMFTARYQVFFLVARPELKLDDLESIGIFSRYTSQHYRALKFVDENNLKVKIIAPGPQEISWGTKELRNLLLAGEVDAILILSPPAHQLQSQGFTILDILIDESPLSLSLRNDKLEKQPKEAQKVVRALERAQEFILTRPEETKEFLLKFLNLEKTEKNLQIIKKGYSFSKTAYDRRNVPTDEGAEFLIQLAKADEFKTLQEVEEQIVSPEEFQKVFDFRFVK